MLLLDSDVAIYVNLLATTASAFCGPFYAQSYLDVKPSHWLPVFLMSALLICTVLAVPTPITGILNGSFGPDALLVFQIFGSISFYLISIVLVITGAKYTFGAHMSIDMHDPDNVIGDWMQGSGKDMLAFLSRLFGISQLCLVSLLIIMYVYNCDYPTLYWIIMASS